MSCHFLYFGGGVFDMTEVFRGHKMMVIYLPFCGCLGGPTFIPNPVMCYQLRLGVCEKKITIFFIVDDFFNNKKSGFLLPAW